ncbi:MAG: hypothetical protein NUW37_03805 [Planctomycetes bacterium]|nr:hypothetical protein [Planctomycetota bacterium]
MPFNLKEPSVLSKPFVRAIRWYGSGRWPKWSVRIVIAGAVLILAHIYILPLIVRRVVDDYAEELRRESSVRTIDSDNKLYYHLQTLQNLQPPPSHIDWRGSFGEDMAVEWPNEDENVVSWLTANRKALDLILESQKATKWEYVSPDPFRERNRSPRRGMVLEDIPYAVSVIQMEIRRLAHLGDVDGAINLAIASLEFALYPALYREIFNVLYEIRRLAKTVLSSVQIERLCEALLETERNYNIGKIIKLGASSMLRYDWNDCIFMLPEYPAPFMYIGSWWEDLQGLELWREFVETVEIENPGEIIARLREKTNEGESGNRVWKSFSQTYFRFQTMRAAMYATYLVILVERSGHLRDEFPPRIEDVAFEIADANEFEQFRNRIYYKKIGGTFELYLATIDGEDWGGILAEKYRSQDFQKRLLKLRPLVAPENFERRRW